MSKNTTAYYALINLEQLTTEQLRGLLQVFGADVPAGAGREHLVELVHDACGNTLCPLAVEEEGELLVRVHQRIAAA